MRKLSRKRAIVVRQGFFQSVAHAAEGDEQESDEQQVVALHAFMDKHRMIKITIQIISFILPIVFPGAAIICLHYARA